VCALGAASCDGIDLGRAHRTNVPLRDPTVDAPVAAADAPAKDSPRSTSPWLHTSGAKVVDANGAPVRLTGASWFGAETTTFVPHGLWARPMTDILDDIKALGYNVLRIPFATQMLDVGSVTSGIDFTKNPSLKGKKPIEVLDAVIAAVGERGMRVILDRHRPDGNDQSPLWYTSTYSEERWIDDWKTLAKRYLADHTVIGFDLHNEPHGAATWGDGDMAHDWRLAAERCGAAVQGVNPELLIIVEGVEIADGVDGWWGGNLRNARTAPVRLPVPNHLVYSTHEYPASISAMPWLSAPDFPSNMPGVWDGMFGYLVKENIAPVWIGELGTKYQTDGDKKWLDTFVPYIEANEMSFAWWCINPDSPETGGTLLDDWHTADAQKKGILAPMLAPPL
jgi:endoglucanase